MPFVEKSFRATKGDMIRMPTPDEEIDPADWYGKAKISIEDWRELWGTPDWIDELAYPQKILPNKRRPANHVDLSQDQWRWEFLRRDADYRDDYEACCKGQLPYKICEGTDPNAAPITAMGKRQKKKPSPLHYDLASMVAPCNSWEQMPQKIFLRRHEGAQVLADGLVDIPALLKNPRYSLFAFDVCRPLAEQITRAQQHLLALQEEATKAQNGATKRKGRIVHRRGDVGEDEVIVNNRLSDDFRRMLRLIDAVSERARVKDIGEILYDGADYHDAVNKSNKDLKKALNMWFWL